MGCTRNLSTHQLHWQNLFDATTMDGTLESNEGLQLPEEDLDNTL